MIKDGWIVPLELDQPLPRAAGPNRFFKYSIKATVAVFLLAPIIVVSIRGIYEIDSWRSDLLVMAFFLWIGFRRYFSTYYKEKKLLKYGCATAANIITQTECDDIFSKRYVEATSVTYSFADNDGNLIVGKRERLPRSWAIDDKSLNLLAEISYNSTVLYDPKDSSKNMLYPGAYAACLLPSGKTDDKSALVRSTL